MGWLSLVFFSTGLCVSEESVAVSQQVEEALETQSGHDPDLHGGL